MPEGKPQPSSETVGPAPSLEHLELWREALAKTGRANLRVASASMEPLLPVGSEIEVEPVRAEEVEVGEVVAIATPSGVVVHRIVACVPRWRLRRGRGTKTGATPPPDTELCFLQKGDGAPYMHLASGRQILGRVTLLPGAGAAQWRGRNRSLCAFAGAAAVLVGWLLPYRARVGAHPPAHPARRLLAAASRWCGSVAGWLTGTRTQS